MNHDHEPPTIVPYQKAMAVHVEDFQRRYVLGLLDVTNGNVSAAARLAQMDRSYLIKLLKKYRGGQ